MLNCSFTKRIPSYQCIGDSLRTINANFSALDVGLCGVPEVIASNSIEARSSVDYFKYPTVNLSTKSEPIYTNEFSYKSSTVTLSTINFDDGTNAQCYVFPYDGSQLNPKPTGTFEVLTNDSGSPQLTLYWMSSSSNSLATVFATNSAMSIGSKGPIWFNNAVDCFYKDNSTLYVGGQFTQAGGTTVRKFAAIDLDGGINHPTLGRTGALLTSPLEAGGDLGSEGTVNFITKSTITGDELIIVGGSFNSATKGRGLVIYNKTLGISYPFYINGQLRDFYLEDTELYVVGEFDFCNYGPGPATISSGARVYAKSIAKISLPLLATSPNACIDDSFASFVTTYFTKSASLYTINKQSDVLYLGGQFRIVEQGQVAHQNLLAIRLGGQKIDGWKCVVNGPVFTTTVDPILSFMYVGGDFSSIAFQDEIYNSLQPLPSSATAHNAACFNLVNPLAPLLHDWKPKFNGPVHKMIIHELDDLDSYVYCMGAFNEVNNTSVGHICAIIKHSAVFDNNGALGPYWPLHLQTGSSPNTNALLKDSGSLFIGGNFTSVNGIVRYHFTKVAGVNESPSIAFPLNVSWDVGGQVTSQNQSFVFDFDNVPVKRSIVNVGPYGTINKTTLEPLQEGFKGLTKNQLCRFYIRRPGNTGNFQEYFATDETYQDNIFLLGWSIDFNKK